MTRSRTPARRPFVHVLLTALGILGTAQASVLHLRVPVAPTALLRPDAASLQAACDAGVQYGLNGMAPATAIDGDPTQFSLSALPAPTIMLITAAGSMQYRCHRFAMDSRAILDARRNVAGTLWITVRGSAQISVQDRARDWAVSLSVRNAAGREVAPLNPSMVVAGRAERWTSSCQDAACMWTAEHRYGFDLGQLPAAVRSALKTAAAVTVEVKTSVPDVMARRP